MSQYLSIYNGLVQHRARGQPLEWVLVYAPEGEEEIFTLLCVAYTLEYGYEIEIQPRKRLHSFGISNKQLIGRIEATDERELKDLAMEVPGQDSQRWTINLIESLEEAEILPQGIAAQIKSEIETAPQEEQDTAGGNITGGLSKNGESDTPDDYSDYQADI